MLDVRFTGSRATGTRGSPAVAALAVPAGDHLAALARLDQHDRAEAAAFLKDVEHTGSAGVVHGLPRPARRPGRWCFVGVGDGGEAGWRAAGAALVRSARHEPAITVLLPAAASPEAIRGLGEGMWLAAYQFRLAAGDPDRLPKLRRVNLALPPERGETLLDLLSVSLGRARCVAEATILARDLTNTPSDRKSPAWFARQVEKAASGIANLSVSVREPKDLAAEGFDAILAVGGGSSRGPRLVELSWRPRGARQHVVLIGKGITFDTGGICIKTTSGMKLMRKDAAGAAAVIGATLGAVAMGLPVRLTALAPLAENALGADAYRPGDVICHYGGMTSEVINTDAEGRLVLADAMAYAVRRLRPDVLVDLATLTGAQGVALGKRTAAMYSDNDTLAGALTAAAEAAGENLWRMPLAEVYLEELRSDIADLVNSTDIGAGSLMAALYLREFTGSLRPRWAHIDMSSPAWADSADGELAKGATGWGVRTLLRWLESAPTADTT